MLREAHNRITMIDPNIRASFIKDETTYRARILRMIAAADIVKVSDEDLIWLMGEGNLAAKARDMLAMGPKIVFVTEGAKGVTAFIGDRIVAVGAETVEVVDTVGAGDTFNAGVLAALHDQGALKDKAALATLSDADLSAAMSLGARAAAVTVSRAGANPPRRSEL